MKLLLILLCSGMILSACSDGERGVLERDYLTSLADTVYAGEERLVFLGDGTGGFYFDDGFGEDYEGEYGYSRFERRFIS